MYHISDNKRRIESAELLSDALFKILEHKPYEEITITDLQKSSSVSRSTFYRLFDNIDDIFHYQLDMIFSTLKEELLHIDHKDLLDFLIDKWFKYQSLFIKIIQARKYSIIVECFEKHQNELLAKKSFENEEDYINAKYGLSVLGCIIIGTLNVWNKYGQKETIKQLHQKIVRITSSLNDLFNQ